MTCQMQGRDTISVIIPVYKSAASLGKTLLSIAAQQPCGRDISILVANDGADAAVTSVCRRLGVSMVAIMPRRGSYFARNCALEKSSGELVVFLDAGIELAENWLCEALSALQTADYLAGEVDIAAVPRPTAAEAYEKLHSYPIAEYMRTLHFGVTAGLMVKKKVLDELGAFDQRLHSGGDLEFGDRVYHAGFTQVYLAEPVLLHPPRRALALFRKQFRIKFAYRHLTRLFPGRFSPKPTLASLAAFLRALLPPHPVYITTEFPPGEIVPAWRRFFFLWLLKICRAVGELVAILAPVPKLPQKPKRIEWSDFSQKSSMFPEEKSCNPGPFSITPSSEPMAEEKTGGKNPLLPKVSVIIPVFNLENFLAETVDSVLAQTCRDFEIILVDDGSSDGSREIIAKYRARIPERVKAIFLDHGGAAAARNAGIAMARGEWIAFLDGDDIWQPSKLAEQLQLAATDPRCNFIASAAEIYDTKKLFHAIPALPFDLRVELLRQGCFITLSTVLIRRDLLARCRFDEKLEGAQEFDLFLRLADSARLGILYQPLAMYRVRPDAISGMLGGRFLQVHRHFQLVRRELRQLQQDNPARIQSCGAEIHAVAQRLAHEAAYYALMNPRASLRLRLRLVAIAIAERPGRAKNYRLLLQSLLPAALNRWLVGLLHPPSS